MAKRDYAEISDPKIYKNCITVNFNNIFNQEDIFPDDQWKLTGNFNVFELSPKRAYCNIKDMIVDSLNMVIGEDQKHGGKFIFNYIKIKASIDILKQRDVYFKLSDFKRIIDNVLLDGYFIKLINTIINRNYQPVLKEKKTESSKVKKGLQFTEEHCKIIFKIVLSIRLAIPLVTHYLKFYGKENTTSEKILFSCFELIINKFTPSHIDMHQKLYKLIDSRVSSTKYSDSVMWNFLENQAIDPNSIIEKLYMDSIISVFPKMELHKNPVVYLHVYIKNQLDYLFTSNYQTNYKAIDLHQTNSEGLSEFDKIEINSNKIDESRTIINRIAINQITRQLQKDYKIKITKDEYKFYLKNININPLKLNVIFLFVCKYIKNYDTLYNTTVNTLVKLSIVIKKILQMKNLPLIADIVTANIDETNKQKRNIDKKTSQKINSLSNFQYLIKTKYREVNDLLMNKDVISSNLLTIFNNKFTKVDYDDQKHLNDTLDINFDELIVEYMEFAMAI